MAGRASPEDDRVCLGVVTGAQGVKGEIRIKPFTEAPQDVGAYGPVETEDGARRFELKVARVAKGQVIARAAGVADRNAAEALKGARLYVPRERLPAPEEETWYAADLVGLEVVDRTGQRLGEVVAVPNYGAGDLVEIKPVHGETVLLPFTKDNVPDVDLAARRLVADPPEGVFDGQEPDD